MPSRLRRHRGLTLMELIAASVLGALVAGGVLTAFLLAAKNTRGSVRTVDAVAMAEETLERFRNKIACDDFWFAFIPDCGGIGLLLNQPDPVLLNHPIKTVDPGNADRRYDVEPWDCDGDGVLRDCYRVKVTVNWNEPQ